METNARDNSGTNCGIARAPLLHGLLIQPDTKTVSERELEFVIPVRRGPTENQFQKNEFVSHSLLDTPPEQVRAPVELSERTQFLRYDSALAVECAQLVGPCAADAFP